ncbi:glycosyltransferase family 2 protein [Nonomuraea sp. NPDC050310]|uniref:glycosyltransferase family 2 protein n=1 Tax=Nonomuraea sp. NPDC050310 TaxID=3154935 RepID=UPI0033D06E26
MIPSGDPDAGLNNDLIGFGRPSPAARLVPLRRRQSLVAAVLLLAGLVLAPALTIEVLVAAMLLIILAVSIFRAVLVALGVRKRPAPGPPPDLPEDRLPTYTVFVPLHQEANVVPPLIEHLSRLDYPADKLDVMLICEARDETTIASVRSSLPDPRFRLVVVPPPDGLPQTKPRACNVALAQTRSDLCVIYDAEDRPELDQLRKAAHLFAVSEPATICLQARLDFYNQDHNWLTRCFTIDYAAWFEGFLPGLSSLGLVVPLGGTSNHFPVARLKELGGWDPYNVTEDVDLALRIYLDGAQTALLDSTTYEEACSRTPAWIRQRTRWMKGYLQTWLVHSRSPAFRTLSWKARMAFRALIAGEPVLAALIVPSTVLWVGVLAALVTGGSFLSLPLAIAVLAVTAGTHLLAVCTGAIVRRPGLATAVLTGPAYVMLSAVAAYRAVWQLFRRPHHWEKTPHGLS